MSGSRSTRRLPGAILAAIAVLVSGGPGAGGAVPAASTTPHLRSNQVETVTSELVLIETYVTDGSGRPVKGLTKDDFILEVGGLRKPISSVEFREFGSPSDAAVGVVGISPALPVPQGGSWPRRFLLFFEDNTSGPLGLTKVREAAGQFLQSGLLPSDEVALASYDERLRLLHDFTTDRKSLLGAVTASMHDSARFSNFAQERGQHLEEFARNPDPMLLQTLCEMEMDRWAGTIRAVETLATSLAGWRGYKAIVYMGDGIPEAPFEEIWKFMYTAGLMHPGTAPPLFETTCSMAKEIKDLSRVASASGVTLDTIQTMGLTAGPARGEKQVFQSSNSLRTLALNTAGIFSTTSDFREAFRRIDEASRAFYVLAYVPEEPADGRYHPIIVRSRRRDVRLRFRRGFTRLPPAEARARAVESAYQFPSMFPALGAGLAIAEGPELGDQRVVDLVLHVPLAKILFLPQAGGATARLSVGFVSIDDARRKAFETSRTVQVRRPEGEADLTGVDLYCRAHLPRVGQTVTAVISDEQSGEVGGAKIRFDEASSPRAGFCGLSLYSLTERSLWIEVPPAPVAHDAVLEASDTAAGPALKQAFSPGEPIVAGFRMTPGNATAPLTFHLEIRRGTEVVRSATVDLGPDDLAGAVKVRVPAEGLATGEYTLSVRAMRADEEIEGGTRTFRIAASETAPSP